MNKKDALKDAVWHLTCSASSLQGLNGFEDIQKEILEIRDRLRQKRGG